MQIHHQGLPEITRYVDGCRQQRLEDKEERFRVYMQALEPFKVIDSETRILEVGTGTGWYPLLCLKKGLQCKGLEISPQLIEYARAWGGKYGLEPDIELGNLEETDLGRAEYDVIIASSVLEHVEQWQVGLDRIHAALRPGGVLLFESTNKFAPVSGEYWLPFYGWLPDRARYWLRRQVQGAGVMNWGIDFNQFTYPLLRREFRKVGFSKVYDRVDVADSSQTGSVWRRWLVRLAKDNRPIRSALLTFSGVTWFVCVK